MAMVDHILRGANRDALRVKVADSVIFDETNDLALDVYAENGEDPGGRPVILFWHGGSWQRGRRTDVSFVAGVLARAGYVVITPSYRLYPKTTFPGYIQDAAQAVAWANQHAPEYGGDPKSIFIGGHSAGAHIAAMLATDPQFLAAADVPADAIKGCISVAGPFDFTAGGLAPVFGIATPEQYLPGRLIDLHTPHIPFLLIHGGLDMVVQSNQSARMAQKIRDNGGIAERYVSPLAEHMLILAAYAPRFWRLFGKSYVRTIDFIERYRLR